MLVASASPLHAADKSDYYKGLDLYHSGDYSGALKAFEAQLEKTPDDETVKKWATLAQEEAAVQNIEAEKKAAAAPAKAPLPIPSTPAQPAAIAKAVGPVKPVAKTPRAAAAKSKDDYERGIALYLSGEYPEALESFQGYLKANPGHMATQQWINLVEGLLPKQSSAPKRALPTVIDENDPLPAPAPEPKPKPAPAKKPAAGRAAEKPQPAAQEPAPLPDWIKPVTAPEAKPVAPVAAPAQAKAPAPDASAASRERALIAEIGRLKAELAEGEAETRRAIEQTKKALALPSPSYQSAEEENIRRAMAGQIDDLRAEQDRLLAELAQWKKLNADLEKRVAAAGAQRSAAPAVSPDADRKLADAQRALQEMTRRYEDAAREAEARKSLDRELAELKGTQTRLLADARRKDTELADARAELRRAADLQNRANSSARTASDMTTEASKLQALLEESRAQGLRLVMDLQKERRQREELEAKLARQAR